MNECQKHDSSFRKKKRDLFLKESSFLMELFSDLLRYFKGSSLKIAEQCRFWNNRQKKEQQLSQVID